MSRRASTADVGAPGPSWRWLLGHQVAVLVLLVAAGVLTRPSPVHPDLIAALAAATALPYLVGGVVVSVRAPRQRQRSGPRPVVRPGVWPRARAVLGRTSHVPVLWGLSDAFAGLPLMLAVHLAGREEWFDVTAAAIAPGLLLCVAWLVVVVALGFGLAVVVSVTAVVRGLGPASWRGSSTTSRATSTGGGLVALGLLTALSALFFIEPAHGGRGSGLLLVIVGVAGPPDAPATVLVRTGAVVMVVGAVVWFAWSRLNRRQAASVTVPVAVPATLPVSAARGRSPRAARAQASPTAPRGGRTR